MSDRASQLEKVLRQISKEKKKKVFYGDETNAMKNLYTILPISEGDYRIVDENSGQIEGILSGKSFDTLKNEQDKCVVFVLPQADGGHAMEKLDKLGLKIEEDYFVIPRLLMPQQGGICKKDFTKSDFGDTIYQDLNNKNVDEKSTL